MDVLDAIRQRRSVRSYTGDPVDAAVLERIVEAARWAPSAMNEQPWHFTIVRSRALLSRIAAEAKTHLLSLPANDGSKHLWDILQDPAFDILYHAPALIVISAPKAGAWMVEDCALAAQNLMLAAFAQGLGSCWIGFAAPWLQSSAGKTALNLPAEAFPIAPIIVGAAKALAPPVGRKSPHVHWID